MIEVGRLTSRQNISKEGEFMAYIAKGEGVINAVSVKNGDLLRGQNLDFTATEDDVLLILVTLEVF